jgi:hypothetical protein
MYVFPPCDSEEEVEDQLAREAMDNWMVGRYVTRNHTATMYLAYTQGRLGLWIFLLVVYGCFYRLAREDMDDVIVGRYLVHMPYAHETCLECFITNTYVYTYTYRTAHALCT